MSVANQQLLTELLAKAPNAFGGVEISAFRYSKSQTGARLHLLLSIMNEEAQELMGEFAKSYFTPQLLPGERMRRHLAIRNPRITFDLLTIPSTNLDIQFANFGLINSIQSLLSK